MNRGKYMRKLSKHSRCADALFSGTKLVPGMTEPSSDPPSCEVLSVVCLSLVAKGLGGVVGRGRGRGQENRESQLSSLLLMLLLEELELCSRKQMVLSGVV